MAIPTMTAYEVDILTALADELGLQKGVAIEGTGRPARHTWKGRLFLEWVVGIYDGWLLLRLVQFPPGPTHKFELADPALLDRLRQHCGV